MITRICAFNLLLLIVGSNQVKSYSQVAIAGSGPGHEDGPKVYKALNMDLIFPKTFNSSENVISTTETSAPEPLTEAVKPLSSTADEQFAPERSSSQTSSPDPEPPIPTNHYSPTFVIPDNPAPAAVAATSAFDKSEESGATLPPPATGRAVDYRPAYPFSQLLTPNSKGYNRPSAGSYPLRSRPASRPSTAHRVVYPSYQASRTPSRAEIDKLSGKGYFSDRFTPGEATASGTFKQKQERKPSISRPFGQSSNKVSSFVPTKDLYTFPPNVNSKYPSPSDIRQASPSDTVTSYLPPAAGSLGMGNLVGPVNPDLLPDSMKTSPGAGDAKDVSGGGYHYDPPPAPSAGYLYNPPETPLGANLGANTVESDDQGPPPAPDDNPMVGMDMGSPEPEDKTGMMEKPAPPASADDHDHHDVGGYIDDKEYPTPPPGYVEEHDHDHDHDHYHDHPHHPDIEFDHGPYFHDHHHDYDHHYHDVVYDDYHDHHFHHDHHPEPLPMTTEPPPPPPPPAPEQPRVKKYSYFYIGRKLWYIPLYFTVWFTFYVLWLILKSIARHKVNLPNHYVSRRSIDELSHREAREAIDKLTIKVMDGIEKFKLRFLG